VAAAPTPSSSTPWGWIVAAIVVVVGLAVLIYLLLRRKRLRAVQMWRDNTKRTLDAAALSGTLIPVAGAAELDAAHWEAIRTQVEEAASALDRAAAAAPTTELADAASGGSYALRGAVMAVEADRLLREGAQAPTDVQLAETDALVRTRHAEMDGSLERLAAAVNPLSSPAAQGDPSPQGGTAGSA
jgi:hypothetical protein